MEQSFFFENLDLFERCVFFFGGVLLWDEHHLQEAVMLFEIPHINSMGLEYTSFCFGTLNTNKGTNIIPPFLGGYLKLCECQRMCVFALLPLKRDWLT